MRAFFNSRRVKTALDEFYELGITGWERWWQTELSRFMGNTTDLIAEWNTGCRFEIDKRTHSSQSSIAIDVGFRLKNHTLNQWHYVELKQKNDYRACIISMCEDVMKVGSARSAAVDGTIMRYIACAGVFLKAVDSEVLDFATRTIDSLGLYYDGLRLIPAGKHYSLLVF